MNDGGATTGGGGGGGGGAEPNFSCRPSITLKLLLVHCAPLTVGFDVP